MNVLPMWQACGFAAIHLRSPDPSRGWLLVGGLPSFFAAWLDPVRRLGWLPTGGCF